MTTRNSKHGKKMQQIITVAHRVVLNSKLATVGFVIIKACGIKLYESSNSEMVSAFMVRVNN